MKSVLVLGCFLSSILWGTAQVSLELILDQDQFLLNESLPVKVRITNRSGQALSLGQEKNWLRFTIESREGFFVASIGELPLEGDLTVESSMTAHRTVDLMPYFDLSQPGRYTVSASLNLKQWSMEVPSKPKSFEISRGTKIWEQEFGVPKGDGGLPEVRKFALQQANYMKRLTLYVRLTDLDEHRVFKVFPAGPLLSISRPEAQIDRASNLHLLFQTGAHSFLYEVVNPEGDVVVRQTHDYAGTRPVLRSSDDGKTFVAGGARRVTATDLPVPSAVPATNTVIPPKP